MQVHARTPFQSTPPPSQPFFKYYNDLFAFVSFIKYISHTFTMKRTEKLYLNIYGTKLTKVNTIYCQKYVLKYKLLFYFFSLLNFN